MNKKYFPFWILTFVVFTGLIVPKLIRDGMFLDGLLYTCVANNLANGIGTFWFPRFSQVGFAELTTFHEHPPLVFGIQALFFKIFGNSIYVERFYSFLTACITAWLIALIWKFINKNNKELLKLSWLPIVMWIIIPVCFWSYQNNMLENTMGIFTLLSVYFIIKGFNVKKNKMIYIIAGGIAVFLASFSKGFPGLFPIGVVFLYWLIKKDITFNKTILYTLILIVVPFLIYGVFMLNNEAQDSLSIYINKRALHRINSDPTVDSRFYIVQRLFMELLPVIVLTSVLIVLGKIKHVDTWCGNHYRNNIIFFLSTGASASLPLMLTMVQKGFYFVHSLPFFAIGFALIAAPAVNGLINRINIEKLSFKIFRVFVSALMAVVVIISVLQINKAERDKEMLHDVYMIGQTVPDGSIIGVEKSLWLEWGLQCYLIRNFNISIDPHDNLHEYYFIRKDMETPMIMYFEKIDINTKMFDLYKLKT